MATEVAADALGEEWKGYVVRISSGNDKQGFPMKQGVLTHGRVRLLLSKGHSCYRPRRTGERKRKSVRGCIVDANLSVLNLVIVKKGEKDIPGLTDTTVPRRLGPKRASRIRKLFNLSKEDDVRQYVVRKPLNKEGKKPRTKAPKIQRLVTPRVLQHKRRRIALKKQRTKKNKEEAAEYAKLLAKRMKEDRKGCAEEVSEKQRREPRDRRRLGGSSLELRDALATAGPGGWFLARLPTWELWSLEPPGLSGSLLILSGQQSVHTGGWLQTSCVEVKGPSNPSTLSYPGLGTSWEVEACGS